MTRIDQFESVFRAAAKPVFEYRPFQCRSVLLVTDRDDVGAGPVRDAAKTLVARLANPDAIRWSEIRGDEMDSVQALLERVADEGPDLVCTYRHLFSSAWRYPYSLGEYLDVITQATDIPVLVLPHPDAQRAASHALINTDVVMAMTDDLAGDSALVNAAIAFTEPGGTTLLAHVEDGRVFDRYMDVISKIPTIDTDNARTTIERQLLEEPADFIDSCRRVVGEHGLGIELQRVVRVGHRLAEYKSLVAENEVDLLVLNTKDKDQLAMHGLAYPVAVELREIPLLLL